MYNRYVVVDIETTGNKAKEGIDKITQIAAVVIENGEMVEIFSTFVNPGRSIPPFITELTGIDDELVQHAPYFCDVAPMIMELLDNACFVAHNVHFDWGFLQEEMKQAGFFELSCPSVDTVELARILLPTISSYKLGDLAKQFGFIHDQPHRADSDAVVTANIFLMLLQKLTDLPLITLQSLYELSHAFKSDIDDILSQLIIDRLVSNSLDERYDIYRGIALRKRSYLPQMEEETIEFPSCKSILQERSHEYGLEYREGQLQMAEEIAYAFSSERISLIEAGTGTGKTLAYLLPSILHAKKTGQPVVVSTQTVQLQQQIMEKEIPFLQSMLPFSFQAAVMKGRKHYICLHKFEYVLQEEDRNYDSVLTKAKILVWLLETEAGDIDELNLPTGGKLLWERICSSRTARSTKNPWNNRCFYQRAKHQVLFADIIIINHALLLQDTSMNESLLSSVQYMILDEAHHIEEAASHTLGEKFSCMQFQVLLSRIGTLDTNDLLSKTQALAPISLLPVYKQIHLLLKDVKWESDELFRLLRSFIFEKNKENRIENEVRLVYRYTQHKERGKLWNAIIEGANRLVHMLAKLCMLMEELLQKIEEKEHVMTQQFSTIVESLNEMHQAIIHLLLQEQSSEVTWLETDAKGTIHSTVMYSQPIDVSDLLADQFFSKKKSVVLTSATLTVNHTFDYIIKALGLVDFCPSIMEVAAPFDYKSRVKMMIPTDLPQIKHVSEEQYVEAIAHHIGAIAKVAAGRVLVLFTSYEMLKKTYSLVKSQEALDEFALLAQGVSSGSRMRMVKQFQQFDKAILFGTSSFWEGIDIAEGHLRCLIMVRLPFSPPNSPMIAAKTERLEKEGKNAFMELALPQAILRFKQGFGRLIRTEEAAGIFIVLDRRITSTFYGKKFITSIPTIPLYEQSLEQLVQQLKQEKD